eukprot:GILK01001227.1.p1 GENE.GILK01001227.1~~GILK01001227.1.p1  ORF type:complete len:394 (+),score=68.29 GILK01001227.1:47-1183(+)
MAKLLLALCLLASASLCTAKFRGFHAPHEYKSERLMDVASRGKHLNLELYAAAIAGGWSCGSKRETVEDLPLMPGLSQSVGYTFNTVTEKPTSYPVYWFTYDMKCTFIDPSSKVEFKVPDQISIRNTPGTHDEDKSYLFHSRSEYVHTKISQITAGVTVRKDLLEGSVQWSQTRYLAEAGMKDDTRFMAYGERMLTFYELSVWPGFSLFPQMQMMINQLPTTYSSADDRLAYSKFINWFGTHYISGAKFGGMVNWTVTYEKHLEDYHKTEWVDTQLKLSLNFLKWNVSMDGGFHSNATDIKFDEDFKQMSDKQLDSLGGDATLKEKGDYNAWLASIPDNPSALPNTYRFQPISEIFQQADKRTAMEAAISDYINGRLQ